MYNFSGMLFRFLAFKQERERKTSALMSNEVKAVLRTIKKFHNVWAKKRHLRSPEKGRREIQKYHDLAS